MCQAPSLPDHLFICLGPCEPWSGNISCRPASLEILYTATAGSLLTDHCTSQPCTNMQLPASLSQVWSAEPASQMQQIEAELATRERELGPDHVEVKPCPSETRMRLVEGSVRCEAYTASALSAAYQF